MQRAAPSVNFVGANAFAALDTVKSKKKKSTKDEDKDKKASQPHVSSTNGTVAPPAFGFGEHKFASTNWADEESDDDFAMAPMADWVQNHVEEQAAAKNAQAQKQQEEAAAADLDIEAELGIELGHENDSEEEEEPEAVTSQIQSRNISEVVSSSKQHEVDKDEDRQLSKKELKKKEMEEMAAVFAELGIAAPEPQSNGHDAVPKKKKKEKSAAPKPSEQPGDERTENLEPPAAAPEEPEGPVELVDPATAKKLLAAKAASGKKKTAVNPAMAKAAADEAKKRAKKAATSTKDKKKHYNQAPR